MPNLQEFLAKAQAMEKEIKELREENEQLNSENSSLTNKVKNLQTQLIALKRTDWLIENENLKKENGRLKQESQEATTKAQATMKTAQTLISENEEKGKDLDRQLDQVRNKENKLDSYIQNEAARRSEKIVAAKKRRLQQQYSDHKRGLRQKEDELEAQFRKLVTLLVTGAAVLGLVVGFVSHTGRVKVQAWHIDRLAKKLDQTKDTVEKQEKRIDRLSTPDQATLERKIGAIDGVGYIVKDPAISQSDRDAASKFVNKEELRELRSELDKSRKAGKVGWWSYEYLKSKLTTSTNYLS